MNMGYILYSLYIKHHCDHSYEQILLLFLKLVQLSLVLQMTVFDYNIHLLLDNLLVIGY